MDVQYLQKNVNGALSEALTSLVIECPDDSIEYLGNYLLNYVERAKNADEQRTAEMKIQKNGEEADEAMRVANKEAATVAMEVKNSEQELANFLQELPQTATSKEAAMDSAATFLARYLDVSSAYVAVNKTVGETETLHYMASSEGSAMLGTKLPKPAGAEEEDAPTRQGVSFECFVLPEVPEGEEEPEEEEEGAEPKPPKPAPQPQPLVIDNVMRDSRVKLAGIPKLGSYGAIPLTLQSLHHDAGVQPGPQPEPEPEAEVEAEAAPEGDAAEGEEGGEGAPAAEGAEAKEAPPPPPKWVSQKLPVPYMLAFDTVGKVPARPITAANVSVAVSVGAAMIAAFEAVEAKQFADQCAYMDEPPPAEAFSSTLPAQMAEAETAALAEVATQVEALPEVPEKEADKARLEAFAALKVITDVITGEEVTAGLTAMQQSHALPPPSAGVQLLYAICTFLGIPAASCQDVCGDLSWDTLRLQALPEVATRLAGYSSANEEPADMTDEALRGFLEANGLAADALPASLPFLPLFLTWMNKVMTARDAQKAYDAAKAEADAAAAEAAAAAAAAAAEGEGEE
jgi:hypothetical protein